MSVLTISCVCVFVSLHVAVCVSVHTLTVLPWIVCVLRFLARVCVSPIEDNRVVDLTERLQTTGIT